MSAGYERFPFESVTALGHPEVASAGARPPERALRSPGVRGQTTVMLAPPLACIE